MIKTQLLALHHLQQLIYFQFKIENMKNYLKSPFIFGLIVSLFLIIWNSDYDLKKINIYIDILGGFLTPILISFFKKHLLKGKF